MLGPLSLELQAVTADTLQQPGARMTGRERLVEAIVGSGFVAALVGLWLATPPHAFGITAAAACFVVLVAALTVRVDTPFGFTVPSQLAFVPLLFAVPLALVPVAVVVASVLAGVPEILRGRARVSRLGQSVGNAWFTIGPVAVFAAAQVSPARASPALLLAALAAQFVVDFAISAVRCALGRGASIAAQLGHSWVYVVDAGLSAIGLLVAYDLHRSPLAPLALLPLLGLVAMFARERRERLESLLEVNDAYRIARDEAIESSKMKSAFLANVSHEIRTPMNGVVGMNELLLETPLDDEQRAYAAQVSRSSEHMLAIINDILDISTIETGHLELDVVEFDLREVIEQACAPALLEARAKDVPFSVEIAARLPERVRGDPSRLRQALMNVVSNAVKFTSVGSVSVRLRPTGDGDTLRFEVADTGIGVDPQVLDRMFEPFTQADVSTTRVYGGNGLGLAISKELVELMGGSIGAHSEPGVGSRFWIELALAPASGTLGAVAEEDVAGPTITRIEPTPNTTGGADDGAARPERLGALVLIVEDSPVNRIVACRVLQRAGFRVQLVEDASAALEALDAQRFAAVLMDCQMPGMDGYEATRELRRRERGGPSHTPVIAMTAHAMAGDREHCLEAGMDDYVTKPVRPRILVEVVRRWIEPDATGGDAAPGAAGGDARHALNAAG